MYEALRPLLFRLPAETAHELAAVGLRTAARSAPARRRARSALLLEDPVDAFGVRFPNRVGVAAGFDKGARLHRGLHALGFGFVEVGTVTALAQPGNPRPRLWRHPAEAALRNAMGFNGPGSEAVARQLEREPPEGVLGVNIGKSRATPLDRAVEDHLTSLGRLERFADYVVVNVSSPNTPGLRSLQDRAPLTELLGAVAGATRKPVLVKLAPDLTDAAVDDALDVAVGAGCAGVVATNTTIAHPHGTGGVSGRPVHARALEVVRRASAALPTVGVGGVFDADGAERMLDAGAVLVQLYTGFVYGGPTVARDITRGLLERRRR